MEHKPLGEILTEKGLHETQQFRTELLDGKHKGREYLDIHTDLRGRISGQLLDPSDDIDYITLVILRAFGVQGTDTFLP